MDRFFTAEETWFGGFYELAVQFGVVSNDQLDAALRAIWETPSLQGCYLRRDREAPEQERVNPSLATQESSGHLLGIATLPNGKRVACGTVLVREEDGTAWLDFYVPLGALASTYAVGAFPVDSNPLSQEWREPLEKWLADVGQAVFFSAPFCLGLIGFEVSGSVDSRDVQDAGVPAVRFIGYLYPSAGKITYYPTNRWHQQPLHAS